MGHVKTVYLLDGPRVGEKIVVPSNRTEWKLARRVLALHLPSDLGEASPRVEWVTYIFLPKRFNRFFPHVRAEVIATVGPMPEVCRSRLIVTKEAYIDIGESKLVGQMVMEVNDLAREAEGYADSKDLGWDTEVIDIDAADKETGPETDLLRGKGLVSITVLGLFQKVA